jgi:hypothetical protein
MEEMNLSECKEHVVYNLVNATAESNEIVYAGCPESYPLSRKPVNSEHKSWSQRGSVKTDFTMKLSLL